MGGECRDRSRQGALLLLEWFCTVYAVWMFWEGGIPPLILPGQPDLQFCLPFHPGSTEIVVSAAGTSFLDVRGMLQGGAREGTPERVAGAVAGYLQWTWRHCCGFQEREAKKAPSAGASRCERRQGRASHRKASSKVKAGCAGAENLQTKDLEEAEVRDAFLTLGPVMFGVLFMAKSALWVSPWMMPERGQTVDSPVGTAALQRDLLKQSSLLRCAVSVRADGLASLCPLGCWLASCFHSR